jgi:predicted ArsR family transcriptional regulator
MHRESWRRRALVRTRRKILTLLKVEGACDSQTLASWLGVSAMGVRQHLYVLHQEKLVAYKVERRPFGRPAKVWRLSPAANRFFPDGHEELTVKLIEVARSVFGRAGLNRWMAALAGREARDLRKDISRKAPLGGRLEALARARERQGYLCELRVEVGGSSLLIENHCPISAAVAACPALCRAEQDMFRDLLGSEAIVERLEHMTDGARRCVYRIKSSIGTPK